VACAAHPARARAPPGGGAAVSLGRSGRLRQDHRPKPTGKVGSVRRLPISKASPEQHDKVALLLTCLGCGFDADRIGPLDAAHLWSRGMGGCDDALCVVGLCRACHKDLHAHKLNLLPALIPRYGDEVAHMVAHANGDLITCLEHLTGGKVSIDGAGEGG
jgi:hypothetical protein